MIKKGFCSKISLCGVSRGIFKELDKNYGVGSIKKSYDCIRITRDTEFHLLHYRKNIKVAHFYQIWKAFYLNRDHYLIV